MRLLTVVPKSEPVTGQAMQIIVRLCLLHWASVLARTITVQEQEQAGRALGMARVDRRAVAGARPLICVENVSVGSQDLQAGAICT